MPRTDVLGKAVGILVRINNEKFKDRLERQTRSERERVWRKVDQI